MKPIPALSFLFALSMGALSASTLVAAPLPIQKETLPEPAQKGGPEEGNEDGTDKDAEGEKDDAKGPLKEWPALEDKAAGKSALKLLLKANNKEKATAAYEKIAALGDGMGPGLLKELGKARDKKVQKRLRKALNSVTGANHTRLLAKEFEAKKAAVRNYALGRVAGFPDAGTRKEAEAAYAAASAEKSKWEPRDRYLAALCCAAAGSDAGWDDLVKSARKDWGKRREELSIALPNLRSDARTKLIIDSLGTDKRQDQVDCCRLLSLCGTKAASSFIKPLLDSGDASIRVAAINACRGVVDGDPPLGDISAFDAIELAKKWKERI